MKLNDKLHWDGFIYGLVYPGFVGSMIYELIPATKADATFSNYFTFDTLTKIVITLFYCTDYLHLYGDIHPKTKPEDRSWTYLWCDVLSSLFFFLAFVMVKLQHYQFSLYFISVIPLFFMTYKWENLTDRYFHIPYLALSLLFAIFISKESVSMLLYFSLVSFAIYLVYVFYYHDNYVCKDKSLK